MQTTTTLATEFETDPRTLRKFLRSPNSGVEAVGKGARYSLPTSKREVNALKKRFTAWDDARKAPAEVETPDEVIDAPEGD